MKPRILVTQLVPEPALTALRAKGEVTLSVHPDERMTRDELIAAVKDHDYLYCMLSDRIDAEILDANSNLKIVANVGVGYDNIDVAAATTRGIPVTNTPGALTETTADLAWALLLGVARRIVEGDVYTRAGHFHGWGPMLLMGTDVFNKTLGIIGFGRIGQAVARRALGFKMNVLYYSSQRASESIERECHATYVSLKELLAQSDFVSLHVPYRSTTHHLIGRDQFAQMKPTAYLINTARGAVVDEAAMVDALQRAQLAGAGLDVYEHEPQIDPVLLRLPNVILLPHIGSSSVETRTTIATMAAQNVIAAIENQRPPNVVNPAVYQR